MQTMTNTGLIRICAYCKRMIGDDNKSFGSQLLAMFWSFTERDKITHGACLSCVAIERKKLAQYKKDRQS